jgi:hypothetical protein
MILFFGRGHYGPSRPPGRRTGVIGAPSPQLATPLGLGFRVGPQGVGQRRHAQHLALHAAAALAQVGRALAGLGLPTVFTFEGGYAVAEVGINTVNVLEGFQAR